MLEENTVLYFRRASLVSNTKAEADMMKMRILPDMVGLPDDELPYYSAMNPTTLFKGPSEEDAHGDINKSMKYWVVCTEDFKIGWVFGEANLEYDIEDKKINDPYNFRSLYSQLRKLKVDTTNFKYKELKVLQTNSKQVDMYNQIGSGVPTKSYDIMNVKTGDRWIFLQSGTAIAIQKDVIELRVGSPNSEPSFIKITPSKIEMVASMIDINPRTHLSLGKHGYQLCGALGKPDIGYTGTPLIPIMDISV